MRERRTRSRGRPPAAPPPSRRDRLAAAGLGLGLAPLSAFLVWMIPQAADPAWSPSGGRLGAVALLPPLLRVVLFAGLGAFVGLVAILGLWTALRPSKPVDPDRRSHPPRSS